LPRLRKPVSIVVSMNSVEKFTMTSELEVFGDELLDWDDLETSETPGDDDTLHIDWDNAYYLPALDGSGLIRAIPVYGTTAAWIRRQEDQCIIDTADAICQPAIIR
jgi:hypothetical protein